MMTVDRGSQTRSRQTALLPVWKTMEEYDEKIDYTIVGSEEADLLENKISNESPIGKALLGKKKNEVVEVEAPDGLLSFKILKITK